MARQHGSAERRRIVAEIQRRREAEGRGVRSLAAEYGISENTYYNWLRAECLGTEVPFRSVEITALVPVIPASTVSLMSPGGYRVEGLSVEDAARLLRALA